MSRNHVGGIRSLWEGAHVVICLFYSSYRSCDLAGRTFLNTPLSSMDTGDGERRSLRMVIGKPLLILHLRIFSVSFARHLGSLLRGIREEYFRYLKFRMAWRTWTFYNRKVQCRSGGLLLHGCVEGECHFTAIEWGENGYEREWRNRQTRET